MKIYLDRDYGEVCAGSTRILTVHRDEPNRFYVIGGDAERDALAKLGMLEEIGDEVPEEQPPESQPVRETKPAPEPQASPASYVCRIHKREHKAGSSAYIACYDANFGKTK